MMKKFSIMTITGIAISACLGVMSSASAALILNTSSTQYMGYYVPPEPASEAEEAGYINILKALAPNTSIDDGAGGNRDFFRSGNTLCWSTCPDATATGALKDDTNPSNTIDLGSGWTYLIGKYDGPNGGSRVWYVDGLSGEVEIPTNSFGTNDSQYGLSHWTLFNPGDGNGGGPGNGNGNGLPEPTALALIGLGMFALGAMRRRKKA